MIRRETLQSKQVYTKVRHLDIVFVISASFHFGVSSDEPIKILNFSCGLDLVLDGLAVQ